MGSVEQLARAFDYPYQHLPYPFNFRNGEARELKAYSAQAMLDAGYKPVLGVGSNCAPEQLARKFGGPELAGLSVPDDGVESTDAQIRPSVERLSDVRGGAYSLTVAPARLRHFDVVYAAYIAHYGSIPATLQGSPGTTVNVCVTFLGERELERMHETESVGVAYDFVKLGGTGVGHGGLDLELSSGERLDTAWTYASRRGCLLVEGENVALAAMQAVGRRFPALSQGDVLEHLWLDYDKGQHASLEEFVLSLIGPDNAARREVLYYRFAANDFDPAEVAVTEDNPFPGM